MPGGHREANESIGETARRELCEETGATKFVITPICVYFVTGKFIVNYSGEESFGMLYLQILQRSRKKYIVRLRRLFYLMNFLQNGHIH